MARDLRKYARQTNFRLIIGFLAVAFLVGDGLIYYFWGQAPALMGLVCMGAALVPAVLVWIILAVMGWIVRKAEE